MIKVLIGAADQALAYDLRAALSEMDGVDAAYVVESTTELAAAVLRLDPDVILVHDRLGPDLPLAAIRDLSLRRPGCAALVVSTSSGVDALTAAMEAGARGLVGYPVTFEELQSRVVAAGEWSQNMRRMLAMSGGGQGADGAATGRGRVICFVGAKGGVGTTTIASHMALDVVRTVPGYAVCLVDLDLEKGDIAGVLEVRHRASIADVAKVADDLSSRAISDAVVVHESGLHLLLTPADVRDVEAVSPRSLREVLGVLRQEYDLIMLDAGSHVTPVQAAAVELADEVVAVTTPDVLAMRGLRRSISHWEGLAVRKETDLRVLINRVSKQGSVSAETVRQLTRAPVISAALPSVFRRLEPALNSRDPFQMRESVWWQSLRAIGHEIGLVQETADPAALGGARPALGAAPARAALTGGYGQGAAPPRSGQAAAELGALTGKPSGRRARRDSGAISVESAALIPLLLLMVFLAWQVVLYGMSAVWSGHASSAAARALSVGEDPQAAARAAVPASIANDITVSPAVFTSSTTTVRVTVRVPLVAPGLGALPMRVDSTRTVVPEP